MRSFVSMVAMSRCRCKILHLDANAGLKDNQGPDTEHFMTKLRSGRMFGLACILLFCTAIASPLHAQTFTTLVSFDGTDGSQPNTGSLAQGLDGNLYGTTLYGGGDGGSFCSVDGCGTVFKMTPDGGLTTIYLFCSQPNCTDGGGPDSGLTLGPDGNLYGTTSGGGANRLGTVFEIAPTGVLTTIYSFCSQTNCTDGESPYGGVVFASDGNFYGTTSYGGANKDQCVDGCGTIFKVTPTGTLTTLYSFCSQPNCADGQWPVAGLVQGADQNLYGATRYGGTTGRTIGFGTLFKITSSGTLTTLYSFCSQFVGNLCLDGEGPTSVVQAGNGSFYGTTEGGGTQGQGTVFTITTQGTLTTLLSFGGTEGEYPQAGLVQATDGSLYGTTSEGGGSARSGTIFKITTGGHLTTLHRFQNSDGAFPYSGVIQSTNGVLYGTTADGGANNSAGTVFSLSVGLDPFVETLPGLQKVGGHVLILGNNLTGTTAVSFNGIPTTFAVVSDTEINTRVPTGATSGFVTATTPSGILTSNKPFRVIP